MDARDQKVVVNLATALSVSILILIDELEKREPGLKSSYAAILADVVANEEVRPDRRQEIVALLRGMLKGLKSKRKGPRTLH
jgi:hypothetical protein